MKLSYLGKNFHGWQIQPNASSVQETLNKVLSTVLREEVYLVGAGRTDTGVHAREMWAHMDLKQIPESNCVHRINRMLGPDIAVQEIIKVAENAHSRFDATLRSYEYHISLRKDPFLQDLAWFCPYSLDLQRMNEAAARLLEFRDFTSFSRSKTQTRTNNCSISEAYWEQQGDSLIFHISADRFLRNMVRAVVGTLVLIGRGKMDVDDLIAVIEGKDRSLAGDSAPAHGLFLTRVDYPKDIFDGE